MAKSAKKENVEREAVQKSGGTEYLIVLIGTIVLIAAIVGYLLSSSILTKGSGGSNSTATLQQFESSLYSAPRIAIFATDYIIDSNNTTGHYTFPCMSSVIDQIVANRQHHRDTSTIDLYIMNSTSCTVNIGLGQGTATSTSNTISLAACNSRIAQEPTIFVNYSSKNTTVIKPNYLYTAGTSIFLSECGIASEIG